MGRPKAFTFHSRQGSFCRVAGLYEEARCVCGPMLRTRDLKHRWGLIGVGVMRFTRDTQSSFAYRGQGKRGLPGTDAPRLLGRLRLPCRCATM